MPEIVSEKIVFDDLLKIEKAELKDGSEAYIRMRLLRQDASAVLLYDSETDEVILTRQFRYAVEKSSPEDLLEIVAGKVDAGELPAAAAIRETEEETGYRITRDRLQFLTSCYSSPGYSTERFFLFAVSVTSKDLLSKGGGLASENEKIEVVKLDRALFLQQIKDGTICDAKTCLAGLLWSGDQSADVAG